MIRKRWHLYLNGRFQGFAVNREKARAWVCGESNYTPPVIDEKRHIKKVYFTIRSKEAIFKEADQ